MQKISFLFPGQGAQYVGMGKDFFDAFPRARQTFEQADEILGRFLSRIIFDGSEQELTLTKNAQPAIYVTSLALLAVVQEQFPSLIPTLSAGLSLGEYSALTAANILSFSEGLVLVQARADFMQQACEQIAGSMSVVLAMDPDKVDSVLKEMRSAVWVANLNCPGQVVIAGKGEALVLASEKLLTAGAKRVLPLAVSGAFHTPLMEEARRKLEPYILRANFSESKIQVVMNALGSIAPDMRRALIDQVTSPVLWEKGIRLMMQYPITQYIEIGCGKTLAGMNKRIGTAAPTLSIEKVSDLQQLDAYAAST